MRSLRPCSDSSETHSFPSPIEWKTGLPRANRGKASRKQSSLSGKESAQGCLPKPLLIATGEAIPLRGLEGVPGLPGAPQDEAGLTRKFETDTRLGEVSSALQ